MGIAARSDGDASRCFSLRLYLSAVSSRESAGRPCDEYVILHQLNSGAVRDQRALTAEKLLSASREDKGNS